MVGVDGISEKSSSQEASLKVSIDDMSIKPAAQDKNLNEKSMNADMVLIKNPEESKEDATKQELANSVQDPEEAEEDK